MGLSTYLVIVGVCGTFSITIDRAPTPHRPLYTSSSEVLIKQPRSRDSDDDEKLMFYLMTLYSRHNLINQHMGRYSNIQKSLCANKKDDHCTKANTPPAESGIFNGGICGIQSEQCKFRDLIND